KTGARTYMQRLAEKGGSFSASPIAADGKLYFASEDGEIVVVKAGPKYELLSVNPMGEVLMATPAISDGMMIVRGQKHVFGVVEKTAEPAKSKTSNQE
ncbi:MAG TPA: PQQ-binding-like beta-propeller repeat protein, partial [Blastocatellia bacterium]|nr:PQQ-binding-like beta-propeller repeat protein [Blastocatellia bacterium]